MALCARGQDDLERTAREIGGDIFVDTCDVSSEVEVGRFIQRVDERFGRIDVLINNAGDTSSALLIEMNAALWNRIVISNLTSVFLTTSAVIPIMIREQYGRIVNMASMAARKGSRYLSAYSAAKHGVLGFTESVALEAFDSGIMVNAVCPGYVDTPSQEVNVEKLMKDRNMDAVAVRQMMGQKNARRRFVSMEEVAQTVLVLSEERLAITGQAIDLW